MWLRAEGGDANHSRAVELYERAAAAGSSRALNGLGYEYFFGHVLEKDEARAYGYFAEAARLGDSGDSLYNAGYCLEHGLGAARDLGAATEMFERARALRSALRAQPRLSRG